jgi:anti-sigma B factor antagonist
VPRNLPHHGTLHPVFGTRPPKHTIRTASGVAAVRDMPGNRTSANAVRSMRCDRANLTALARSHPPVIEIGGTMLTRLDVRTVNDDDHVVEVVGDVTGVDAPRLAEALVQFDAGDVIVDLSAVTTIDGAGMRALDAARRHIERRRGQLIVNGDRGIVGDAFEAPTPRAAIAFDGATVAPHEATMTNARAEAVRGPDGLRQPPARINDRTEHGVPASDEHAEEFFVDTAHVADAFVLRFVGELDLQFADEAKRASIAARIQHQADTIDLMLDLSRLTFCDASGISVIVQLAHEAATRGQRIVLRDPTPNVRRVLTITQLDTWLDVEDTPLP